MSEKRKFPSVALIQARVSLNLPLNYRQVGKQHFEMWTFVKCEEWQRNSVRIHVELSYFIVVGIPPTQTPVSPGTRRKCSASQRRGRRNRWIGRKCRGQRWRNIPEVRFKSSYLGHGLMPFFLCVYVSPMSRFDTLNETICSASSSAPECSPPPSTMRTRPRSRSCRRSPNSAQSSKWRRHSCTRYECSIKFFVILLIKS